MDNVQEYNICTNLPSSQTLRSYLHNKVQGSNHIPPPLNRGNDLTITVFAKFPQTCMRVWRFNCGMMCRCVVWGIVTDISEECSASNFYGTPLLWRWMLHVPPKWRYTRLDGVICRSYSFFLYAEPLVPEVCTTLCAVMSRPLQHSPRLSQPYCVFHTALGSARGGQFSKGLASYNIGNVQQFFKNTCSAY
jgi:hypothetical protein